ncbi:hypothetical protein CRUP_000493 [Coryphaenoides rupestris]|nr:hypothetical protein CRUP_000493 [Coryphaenoides rupestris]
MPVRPLALGRRMVDSTSSHSDLASLVLHRAQHTGHKSKPRPPSANQSCREALLSGEGRMGVRANSPPQLSLGPSRPQGTRGQLQETLQQREEELTRLQHENDKLRHFLSSSFVRDLEENVKGLRSDPRRNLKRSLQQPRSPPAPQHISKRICRNLFPEFCCDSAPSGEPDLDLWILQTLGLKDRDTIDPSASPSSSRLLTPPPPSASPSSSRLLTPPPPGSASPLPSSSSSRLLTPPPPFPYEAPAILPDLPLCLMTSLPARRDLTLSPGLQHPHPHSAPPRQGANQSRYSPGQRSEDSSHRSAVTTERCHPDLGLPSPLTQGLSRTLGAGGVTPGPLGLGSGSASGPDPPRGFRATNTPQSIHLSSPCTTSIFQTFTATNPGSHTLTPPPGGIPPFQVLTPPHTPGGQKEAVFRGPLSPSCSLKTHSFPQGQAFIRKDSHGHWGFTWFPKQEP